MPLILLAEDEAPTVDHVRSVLASQGWLVKTVDSRDQALRAASEFAPQLVLVNDRLAGADDLVRTFSRRSGGPGVVLLSADQNGVDGSGHDTQDVEAVLIKPLEAESLITTIRDRLAEGQEQKTTAMASGDKKLLTSKDIFGDLLDDILDPDQDVVQAESTPAAEASISADQHDPSEPSEADQIEVAEEEVVVPEIEVSEEEAAEPEIEAAAEEVVEEEIEAPPVEVELDFEEAPEAIEEVVEVADAESSEDELADLEDMVREEVGAWAETVEPTDDGSEPEIAAVELALAAQEEEVAAAQRARIPEDEKIPEVTPEDLDLQPVIDAFDEEEIEAAAKAEEAGEDEVDLAENLATAVASEAEAASAEPEPVEDEDDLDSRLEDTLAGVLADSLTATAPDDSESAAAVDVGVDALLSDALGGLGVVGKTPLPKGDSADEEIEVDEASDSGVEVSSGDEPAMAEDTSEATPEPDSPSAAIGEEFGEYTLEKRIGLGGMAEVWKARRKGVEGFEKRVAIKKILPQAAENEAFVEMFIDEAKLAAQLNHNNIIHIYDLGRLGDDYYIAMEYVDGKNLRQLLTAGRKKSQPIPEGIALHIASRLADALDYAHNSKDFEDADLGLVHRDVSPQNVLICIDGQIKLCDFGIAKAVSKMSTTQMGALKGKLQYMSPEQAWGKSIDHRSDIFSLGTLLFEMLTRERLFAGESEMSVLESVREADVGERIIQSSEISAGVKGLLLRALAQDPENRFDKASEFQAGIDEILGDFSPTPGQKEVANYIQSLLELPAEESTSGESTSEPEAAEVADIANAEWVSDEALNEVTSDGEESGDDARKQAWLKKLLTKLMPVILLMAGLGAVLGYTLTRDDSPAATTSEARAPTAQVDQSAQPASFQRPEPVQTPAQTQIASTPEGDSRPPQVDQEPSAAPAETEQSVPLAEAAPALDQGAGIPTGNTEISSASELPIDEPPSLAEIPTQEAIDPDLERRVEEDLQRVQELISSSPIEEDSGVSGENPSDDLAPGTDAPLTATVDTDSVPPSSPQETQVAEEASVSTAIPDTGPTLITFSPPAYTPATDAERAAGTVRVSVLVDEYGRVMEALLVEGLPQYPGLDDDVMAAARSASFEPAIRDGSPVRIWYELAAEYEP